MSWERIDLSNPDYAEPSDPPTTCGLIYPLGARHVFSGPPESAKTTLAFILALEFLRSLGRGSQVRVAHIDFEMGAMQTRRLLDELGATEDEIRRIDHFEPTGPPGPQDIHYLTEWCRFTIIDAAAGAYDASDLDDNKRKDAETFARAWIRPLWQDEVTTLTLDHVTKNSETRGKYTIGSERKVGQADVHFGLETVKPLVRGGSGLFKIVTHKDRFGHLPRPRAADLHLVSDPITHAITWTFQAPAEASNEWKPTILMEKVSRYLEVQTEPISRAAVERANLGKRVEHIRQAMDALIAEGYADEQAGSRSARMLTSTKPYRTSSDLVPTSSDEVASTSSTSSPAYRRDEVRDEDEAAAASNGTNSAPFDAAYYESVIDQELLAEAERLIDKHADLA